MAYQHYGEKNFESRLKKLASLYLMLAWSKYYKWKSWCLFVVSAPVFFLFISSILFLRIFGLGKPLTFYYIKFYFQWYFFSYGVLVMGEDKDKKPFRSIKKGSKPKIIFTNRMNNHEMLYLLQALEIPFIVPLSPKLAKRFSLIPGIPFLKLERLLSYVSYPDYDYKYVSGIIASLVKKNFSVVVYLNQGISHAYLNNEIAIYEKILSLGESTHDRYVLSMMNWEAIGTSTMMTPLPLVVKLKALDSLFEGLSDEGDRYASLLEFFMYSHLILVKEDTKKTEKEV